MLRRYCVILAAILISGGCAATGEVPKFQFAAGTRVGIINHLESYAIHQNFQPLRIENFTKEVTVDWKIPEYATQRVKDVLKSDSRFSVISLKPEELSGALTQFEGPLTTASTLDQETIAGEIKPELAGDLNALANKNNLDVIIWIRSYKGPSVFKIAKNPIELQGYGLFTRELLLSKKAYAYANIEVVVIKTPKATYIGSGTSKTDQSPLNDFKLPDDLKNIAPSEFNKLKPIIQNYADEAVNKALLNANVIVR